MSKSVENKYYLKMKLSPTLKSLVNIGFHQVDEVAGMPTVVYDFQQFTLECSDGVCKHFSDVVLVSGVLNTGRTIAQISHEIPSDLRTSESVAAWLSYALRSHESDLEPRPDWFVQGKQNQHLIPEVADQISYRNRPKCFVDRDYAKVLRRRIHEMIDAGGTNHNITVMFNGTTLTFDVAGERTSVLAQGDAWTGQVAVKKPTDFRFPAKFQMQTVTFDFWKNSLGIGNHSYLAEWI